MPHFINAACRVPEKYEQRNEHPEGGRIFFKKAQHLLDFTMIIIIILRLRITSLLKAHRSLARLAISGKCIHRLGKSFLTSIVCETDFTTNICTY